MQLFRQIETTLGAVVAKSRTAKPIDIKQLQEHLQIYRDELNTLLETLKSLSIEETSTLTQMVKDASHSSTKKPNVTIYSVFKHALTGDANRAEDVKVFSSLQVAGDNLLTMLDKFLASMSEKADATFLLVENAKLSHLALFGLIQQIGEFVNFSTYLVTGVMSDLNGEMGTPPKMRQKYLEARVTTLAEMVSVAYRRMGTADFINTYVEVQKDDVKVVTEDGKVDLSFVKPSAVKSGLYNLLRSSLGFCNIFQWFGERWNTLVHLRYQRMQNMSEWMKTRVEILRMDLNNVDPNSDEYRKRIKIVESYDDMITDLDTKINKYMEP